MGLWGAHRRWKWDIIPPSPPFNFFCLYPHCIFRRSFDRNQLQLECQVLSHAPFSLFRKLNANLISSWLYFWINIFKTWQKSNLSWQENFFFAFCNSFQPEQSVSNLDDSINNNIRFQCLKWYCFDYIVVNEASTVLKNTHKSVGVLADGWKRVFWELIIDKPARSHLS